MAEDEAPNPAEPEASQSASPASETAAEPTPVEPAAPPKVEPAPTTPPNKLHEWGAALAIMVFLAFVLWVFLNFLRSTSL